MAIRHLLNGEPVKKWGSVGIITFIIIIFASVLFLSVTKQLTESDEIYVVLINTKENVSPPLNQKFLSVAIDSSQIANGFKEFNMTDPKLLKLTKALYPAYLRVGGNLADRLEFTEDKEIKYNIRDYIYMDYLLDYPNFTMNGKEWLNLNKFANTTGLELIFDLNALRRFDNNSWDYRNAEKLIDFSQKHNLFLNWELGNEPNSFEHKFKYIVPPSQMAKDYQKLREILNKYPNYKNSKIIGPSVTRPRTNHPESEIYLKEFLANNGAAALDAITWHQYYFDGRTARCVNFLDPFVFDVLKWQSLIVRYIARKQNVNKPIWLGETSSAYGGGAPGYSDRFLASFIWLDKLGVAAQYGINIVIRQSLFGGDYALIGTNDYYPSPDWWISVLYKKFVGPHVMSCYQSVSLTTRIYCQCKNNTITLFGMNLDKNVARIRIEGLKAEKANAYILTTHGFLRSRSIFMNKKQLKLDANDNLPNFQPKTVPILPFIALPGYSLFFLNIEENAYCI